MEQVNNKLDDHPTPLVFRSGLITFTIILIYLLLIYIVVPLFMKHRKPYKLTTFITFYNIFQVLSCIKILHMIHTSNTPYLYFWQCSIATNNNHEGIIMEQIRCVTFWVKGAEFIETVVFALRKKNKQISILHVFHHCTVFSLIHLTNSYFRGEKVMYPLFINCIVHIIMYVYYLLSAVCSENVLRRLKPVKKYITVLQMVQFTLILIQALGQVVEGCEFPTVLLIIYVVIVSAIFYMFYDFYKKSYNTKKIENNKDNVKTDKLK